MTLHDCNVNGIASRQQTTMLSDLGGTQDVSFLDRHHFVNDFQDSLKRRSNDFALIDSRIAVQYFLQHLGVRNQTLTRCDQALQYKLCLCLMRM